MMNLPPELIQIIFFKLCLTKTVFPLRDDPRLLLTHVCSQWRAIALGMPNLWANLCIPINLTPPHDHIRAWISRSAQSALSVGFHGPSHRNTFSVEIFDLIVPVIQRCASLKLCIDDPTLTRLFTLPPGSLCALRSISIRSTSVGDARIFRTTPRVTAFQHCPRLRHVKLELMGHPMDPLIYELPWHQLTHLSIGSCRGYGTLDVLRQCTALQECSISTFPVHRHDAPVIAALALQPVVLPSLHTLRLELGNLVGRNIHFVRALRLPRLRSLRLAAAHPRALLPLSRALLTETVRNLDLSRWTAVDIPAALALVPNLETLKFRNSDIGVLRALGGGAAPRLVALRLDAVRWGDLFDMLEARAAAARIADLTDVSALDLGGGVVDVARLAGLRASGMRLVFRNRSL